MFPIHCAILCETDDRMAVLRYLIEDVGISPHIGNQVITLVFGMWLQCVQQYFVHIYCNLSVLNFIGGFHTNSFGSDFRET